MKQIAIDYDWTFVKNSSAVKIGSIIWIQKNGSLSKHCYILKCSDGNVSKIENSFQTLRHLCENFHALKIRRDFFLLF